MIKVAITDDHEMVVTGLQQMLADNPDMCLTGVYLTAASLMEGLRQHIPDVLLLDLQLPDRTGEEVVADILANFPSIKILILSSIDDIQRVKHMMQIGCKGYSLKNVSKSSLIEAIKNINKGNNYLDPVLQEELLHEALIQKHLRPSYIPDVTRREKEILVLLSEGYSSKDIADRLFLSVRTVDNHRKSLLQKFDVKNSLALLKAAKAKRIIE